MRKTNKIISRQKGQKPLVCLTAYTARIAQILDNYCDLLLVGDSMAMVLYGFESTLKADMDMMIRHGKAVVRSSQKACVIVDMPFGSYQESKETAFRNAAIILKETECQGVKLEGGQDMADTISYLTQRGIPVMAHIGLEPQSVNTLGGYQSRGHTADEEASILKDAHAVSDAGAFAVVVEGVTDELAEKITKAVSIPTIGIGASAQCDGQILVTEDMLGISDGKKPRFVKSYADISPLIEKAVQSYAEEVTARTFPSDMHVYKKKSA